MDLETNRVEVHRAPGAGGYTGITVHEPGDQLSPLALPDLSTGAGAFL